MKGFRDAGDALFPPEQTYLDAPGFRLVSGGYRRLELVAGSELVLLARSSVPNDTSLYSMRYADPKPCAIPNVGRHQGGRGGYPGPALLGYLEPKVTQGTLHFADANCRPYPLTVPDAVLPMADAKTGFVVGAAGNLLLVDPVANTTVPLVSNVSDIELGALDDIGLILADGRLGAFRSDWTPIGWFGRAVVRRGRAGRSYFFEDATGIHRLTARNGQLTDTVIAALACALSVPGAFRNTEAWLTYRSPCDSPRLTVFNEETRVESTLNFEVDPTRVVMTPAWPETTGNPGRDPFYFAFLTEVDESANVGTLVLRTPAGKERRLGERAALERLRLNASAAGLSGYALVDIDGDTGTFVKWSEDGTTQTLAQKVFRNTADLLINFDGSTGDLALLSETTLSVVAHGVPPNGFQTTDGRGRWTVLVHQADGGAAALAVAEGTWQPSDEKLLAGKLPQFEAISSRVFPYDRTRFLNNLPAIAYFAAYDSATDTGQLVYRNLELGFTSVVSSGLADYLSTGDGLIYSVPYGDKAGIWLARGR